MIFLQAPWAALLTILALAAGTAHSQTANGILSGIVTDSSGGALQGVVVEAREIARSAVAASATTDATGSYMLLAPAGTYEVHMHLPGFAEHRRVWEAIGTATQDVTLGLAPLSERIAVTSAPPSVRQIEVSGQSSSLPAAVTVINHEEIARTNVERDAGNLFRRVPGVVSHNLNQGNTGTSIKMRGFLSSTHGADTAVYIDGVPQNVPSASINHGMNDMSWLTPDMIERIEIIKGPVSALYGDQNRSGAVNIVTRSSSRSSAGVTLGSYGNQRAAGVLSGEYRGVQGLFVTDLYRLNGYRSNSAAKMGTVFAKGSMVRGRSLWALRAVHHKSNWDAPGFLNLNSVLNGTVNPTDRDPTAPPLWGNARRSSLVFTRTPSQGEAGLQVSAYLEDYLRTRVLGANPTDLNVQVDDRWIMGARAIQNLLFGDRGGVAFGGEIRRDRGDAIHRRWPAGAPGPNYTFNQDLNLMTYGIFAQGQFKPIDTLKLLGGVRLDTFDYDIQNRKLPAASLNYKQSAATPRAGLVWTPFRMLDLFTNVGEGIRSPNQSEISPSGNVGPLSASGGRAFPDLKPPKIRSYDFGMTLSGGERWRVSAAKYHTLNQKEIVAIGPGIFDSVGNITRDGWEIESRMAAIERLNLYGSYGRIARAKINGAAPGTADRLSVPADTIKGGAGYIAPLRRGQMLVNVDLFYVSGIPYFAGAPLSLFYARPYTRFDARITYEGRLTELTTFATFQPVEHISEVALGSAAGLLYDPRPKAEFGIAIRFRR